MSKSFYRDANTTYHGLLILSAVAMLGLSVYLTVHYFTLVYPKGLGTASLCDISSFFNCDITTFSPLSNIVGVPISVFGGVIGVFLFLGYAFKSDNVEGTNHFILYCNIAICTLLCIYSFFALGGFCPFCFLYYVFSGLAFFVFYKTSTIRKPHFKPLTIYGVITAVLVSGTYAVVRGEEERMSKGATEIMKLYDALPTMDLDPDISPYYLTGGKGSTPVVRIVKFSDFQCPSCKIMSEVLHKATKKYKDKVSVQYSFYPLDHNCNPQITRPFHTLACESAYLASCFTDKFAMVESDIFANQQRLSKKWLSDYAKRHGVHECYTSSEARRKVGEIVASAQSLNIVGTPTLFINGKKIDRLIPLGNLFMILDSLLERAEGR